ncbi:DMT family transporter [Bradyrhizobium sediminis]|uniref:DMT family transporter n=1 Tax=Bradyrhizobium sediminis TaxID=2840469 RepID=A0A975RMF6_9BRAD|nr:DMT family transporter [Bradyrhizobium sediminis]QWG13572.1 DMT family transporter [Bradyrhizobium sediminis]
MTISQNQTAISLSGKSRQAPALLVFVGTLLAFNVILSKQAAASGAAMLWYLTVSLSASGLVLILLAARGGDLRRKLVGVLPYSIAAGALLALGMALGYLAVGHVGAAFIALAMAFPTLLTYLMSLALRMERHSGFRLSGVALSLAGGLLLARAKGGEIVPVDRLAILVACMMPVVLAIGNIFRSRYWPHGATPLLLAGSILLCGALATFPFAIWIEGGAVRSLWTMPAVTAITALATLSFTIQYVAVLRLQQIAGPTYLSQIGSVAAISGTFIAVAIFDERLPDGFGTAAIMIALGIVLFQLSARRR